MYGSAYKKPTQIVANAANAKALERCCNHDGHPKLTGKTSDGTYKTKAQAAYTGSLCRALANMFVQQRTVDKRYGFVSDHAAWDRLKARFVSLGRPSLGGLWYPHPTAADHAAGRRGS